MSVTSDRVERAKQRAEARKKRVAEAKKLYEEGDTTVVIAEKLGVKESTVDVYLGE
jgi:uncharacterized protein YjcR